MLVMDVIAEILKREGISTLFCFPTTPIIEAAAASMIGVVGKQKRFDTPSFFRISAITFMTSIDDSSQMAIRRGAERLRRQTQPSVALTYS